MRFRFFIIAVLALIAAPALAQSGGAQKSLGTFGVWQAYNYEDKGQPVCYMVKAVHIPAPKNKKFKRGPAFLMITHRPAEGSTDVVSYSAGYNLKVGSDLTIKIGKNSFDLFTQKDSAWSRDSKTDHALASAIRNNGTLRAIGIPAQNLSAITDTLDLKGSADAYRAIGKACGMEQEPPPKAAPAAKKKVKKR